MPILPILDAGRGSSDLLRPTAPIFPLGQGSGQPQPKGLKGLWARLRARLAKLWPKRQ
jgi:hypothetical protein